MGLADALAQKFDPGASHPTQDEGAEQAAASLPQRLGRFEVRGRLGAGAMGVVYTARDPMLCRDIAIKVLAAARTSHEAMLRARREAQALAQVSHPNVVNVFAIGEHEGQLYIAMEHIRGETLRSWQSARRSPEEVLAAYRQAGRGLAELHAHGLVHRDFKPANAMIGEDGRVRVLDLGLVTELVRHASSEAASENSGGSLTSGSATQSDAFLGTPAYMSPEQFLGEPVTPASDQFSFCIALYEALYGVRPFQGKSMAQLVEAICDGQVGAPPADSAVPRRIFDVLRRGLARYPQRRHASMEALVEALSGGARRVGWVGVVGLIAITSVGAAWAAGARDEACSASVHLARTWSPERTAALSDPAQRGVGRYADELARVTSEACAANASPLVLACHEELVTRFDATVGLLIEAPEGLASEQVIEGLVDPSYCDGAESRPGSDGEMAKLSGLMQRVDSLALSGLFDEALQEADKALHRAQVLGRPSLSSEAFNQRGKVHARTGNLSSAHADFAAAYELAVVTGAHVAAARIALSQVWVTQRQNDLDGAGHWLRVATSEYEASGGNKKGLRARISMREGEVALARGDMSRARDQLTQAVAAYRDLNDAREEATALASLVAIELDGGDFDAALVSAQRALAVFAEEFGDKDPQLGTHYQNLGNVYQRRGQHEEALVAYDEALRRRAVAYGDAHPAAGEARYSKATTLMELSRADEARTLLERVQRDAPASHPLAAAADTVLSQIASDDGDHDKALDLANKAFVFYEAQFGSEHAVTAEVQGQLAAAKLAAGDLSGALADARAARRVLEARFGQTHDLGGQCLGVEAAALVGLGKPDQARPLYERALGIAVAAQGESSDRATTLRAALAALRTGA